MHVECCGSGDPILFIHGMPTNGRLWRAVTDELRERYTCFTIDLPGLGKSPKEQYGPHYFQRLASQIDALRIENKIEKWHVVGHDAGSAITVHYAHYFQQHLDCMALLSPAFFPELRPYYLIEPLRKRILGELLAPLICVAFWQIAMHRALEVSKTDREVFNDFYKPFSGITGPWKFMQVLRWGKPEEMLAQVPEFLHELLIPTLIFHGSEDPAIPETFARRASSLIPNSRMMILDSGHFIPLSQPRSVAASLAALFESRSAQVTGLPIT
ncbi:alpha/beta fold hydrolase [Granulicella arctica]|uniref:Pimeloyl-ACP methyl ester carboxylesterase n=1 Tax=Granulicella arctica TaxID=940613 RepID=A0A7Y9PE13_9BACT|nr:alpha/beta hydrolase [Granulicella arctica]NYF78077.1 pimeloyl-ACP methyl ester carboxylesterase [Granulicella arctica]